MFEKVNRWCNVKVIGHMTAIGSGNYLVGDDGRKLRSRHRDGKRKIIAIYLGPLIIPLSDFLINSRI